MIVYGKQIFFYIIQRHPKLIKRVLLSKKIAPKLLQEVKRLNIPIETIDNKKAQALSRGGNHQGFLLEIEEFRFTPFKDIKQESFLVVLYGVTDVGNIGSIVRSAYALGADGLVLSGIKSMQMAGVIRKSSGAALDLPIALKSNIFDLIKELHDCATTIYCAHMDGEDVRALSFCHKRAIILGSEGEGINKKVLKRCDQRIKIEMKRDFDSLNVAAAAAIFIDRMRDE